MKFQVLFLVCLALASCTAVETVPHVSVTANSSGLDISEFQPHGPRQLLRKASDPEADIPSGTSARISRLRPLHNTEPRYFTPASGSLQVVSIEQAANYRGMPENIRSWRSFTDSSRPLDKDDQARLHQEQIRGNEIPWINAAPCFHAKLRRESFPWGNAVLFLTCYVQGATGGPVNNDMLVLVVQGFTHDGRYAVNGHFEIGHPKLPNSLWDKHSKQKTYFDIDNETARAEAWLDQQDDTSFQPAIATYLEFLRALKIETGNPFKP